MPVGLFSQGKKYLLESAGQAINVYDVTLSSRGCESCFLPSLKPSLADKQHNFERRMVEGQSRRKFAYRRNLRISLKVKIGVLGQQPKHKSGRGEICSCFLRFSKWALYIGVFRIICICCPSSDSFSSVKQSTFCFQPTLSLIFLKSTCKFMW